MPAIGILGDGQLALMLTQAARALGIDTLALSTSKDSPMARLEPEATCHIGGLGPDDDDALIAFARRCDVLTLESEFWRADRLAWLQSASGTPIIPSAKDFSVFEGKLAQRRFFSALGLPGPRWLEIAGSTAAVDAADHVERSLGLPVVVKADHGGYDGLGVRVAATRDALITALQTMGLSRNAPVLVEEKVAIRAELAQGILLTGHGPGVLLPLVETVQRDGVCVLVLPPDGLPADVQAHAAQAVGRLASSGLVGLYNLELFWTESGEVLINEGAPRPHNSQHVTIDGSPISQFGLLASLLARKPLPPGPVTLEPVAMVNLLGRRDTQAPALRLPPLPSWVEARPMLYGKTECRPGRKMGHVNLVVTDPGADHDLRAIGEKVFAEYEL